MKELKEFTVERLSEIEVDAYEANPTKEEMRALAKIALAAKQGAVAIIPEEKPARDGPLADGWNACRAKMLYTTPPLNHTEQDGWVKCSDRIPSKDQCVSISDGHLVGVWRYRGWWPDFDGNGCASTSDPLLLIKNITHWMPLPAAPKPEGE